MDNGVISGYIIWLLTVVSVPIASAAPGGDGIQPIAYTDTRLDNGLRVLIAEDHHAPVYSIAVTYRVGSRDERPGRTGLAHLFEHMMFKGSDKVGPGEHLLLVSSNGGNVNATTNTDRTIYFETLPSNQIDLGLFLEADRMRSLAITDKNLQNQRNAVQEERRISIDNRPYGRTFEKANELAFENFAYQHWIFGSMEDLNAATVDEVKQFFRTYYSPNNAVLAVVGDLNAKDSLAKVKKYFEAIPRQTPPPVVDLSEPPQAGERRLVLEDKLARLVGVNFAYKAPPGGHEDSFAFGILDTILASGETSRLYQNLVKETQVAELVLSVMEARVGPSLYHLTATVRQGKTAEDLEKLVNQEIGRLQSEPVLESELRRARNAALRSMAVQRESSVQLASHLAEWTASYNDPERVNTMIEKQLAVTPADVMRVARRYLNASNRTVIYTVPSKPAAANAVGNAK
jgi:predicted Zn-dependent peptidase